MVDINTLVRQAKEMQNRVRIAQEELAKVEIEGEAGGGLVKVTMTGAKAVRRVAIDDKTMDDKDTLEDLLAAAFNNAKDRADEIATATMEEATGGMDLPAGL
ncbi:MAG: YbaB/EbfC family nucleoid-associated protein [Rickettsiales bacterium]|jgi:DNA-binding YbaB/EbfC family protein|nr:YbaB/EbfC family nucleoid-associated protein [Rickettsiales bacterium]